MSGPEIAYLAFGLTLCALLAAAIAYTYSSRRRAEVEEAKYKMMDDE
ncbi:MAG TPA: CcoQ/FixQ family Cbb3-type cytochrome c oxidase assembly chaperone [Anaeromyxobacteraceae bacterium]|jgi:hypothetical protein